MCIRSKGNGYSPTEVVERAMKDYKLSPRTFFALAAEYGSGPRLDVSQAVAAFIGKADTYQVPARVRSFADWIVAAPPERVRHKIGMHL